MINTKQVIKDYFVHKKQVLSVYLFGSVAKGKENRFSDVDIAVLFDFSVDKGRYTDKCLFIMDGLSKTLNRNIDVAVLNNASSFFKSHILKNGIKIYEKPGSNVNNFRAQSIVEYLDYLPIRKRLEKAVIDKIYKEA